MVTSRFKAGDIVRVRDDCETYHDDRYCHRFILSDDTRVFCGGIYKVSHVTNGWHKLVQVEGRQYTTDGNILTHQFGERWLEYADGCDYEESIAALNDMFAEFAV